MNATPQLVAEAAVPVREAARGVARSPSKTQARGPWPRENARMKQTMHMMGIHPYSGPGLCQKYAPKVYSAVAIINRLVIKSGLLLTDLITNIETVVPIT